MTATMIKTAETQKTGQYIRTEIDDAKDAADIRILDIDGTATIDSRVELSGRGVTPRAVAGRYEVTKAALKRLQAQFNVVTDF